MNHCSDCKYSEEYFRGLLCHWVEENGLPDFPPYLSLNMSSFAGSFPKQIDSKDYGNVCSVFEKRISPQDNSDIFTTFDLEEYNEQK